MSPRSRRATVFGGCSHQTSSLRSMTTFGGFTKVDRIQQNATPESLDAYQYVFDSPYVKTSGELLEYAQKSFPPNRPLLEAVKDLTTRIHKEFQYDPKATTLSTTIVEVLKGRRGVCQDFAHLEIGCLRSLGLAARYISGYLLTLPRPGEARLVGADASCCALTALGWEPTLNVHILRFRPLPCRPFCADPSPS